MKETGTDAECNTSCETQPDDLCLSALVRSESFSMIVDPPTSSMAVLTPASNQLPIQVQGSIIPSIVLPFYRLAKPNNRCAVCGDYFSNSDSSVLQTENDIRTRAYFVEHSILIMVPSRCCNKHVNNGYFTTTALQVIEREEKTWV